MKHTIERNVMRILDWNIEKIIIYKSDEIDKNKRVCFCGKILDLYFILTNSKNRSIIRIGECCVRNFTIKLSWKGLNNYMISAFYMNHNEWERQFIIGLMKKYAKWGSSKCYISEKQKHILESITSRKYRWKTWTNRFAELL